jgi:hypothetical protein
MYAYRTSCLPNYKTLRPFKTMTEAFDLSCPPPKRKIVLLNVFSPVLYAPICSFFHPQFFLPVICFSTLWPMRRYTVFVSLMCFSLFSALSLQYIVLCSSSYSLFFFLYALFYVFSVLSCCFLVLCFDFPFLTVPLSSAVLLPILRGALLLSVIFSIDNN